MTSDQIEFIRALLRQDLTSFIHKVFQTVRSGEVYFSNWHIEAIAYCLEQCFLGNIKRLIITLPPRHLKSIAASVAFPAWVLGKDPTQKIVCVSYSQDLSAKHALDTRTVLEAGWYRDIFPHTRLNPHKNAIQEFMTTRGGFRLATSIGGTLTGRGGNLIIIDDPHKPEEVYSDTRRQAVLDWHGTTLFSRLDNKSKDVIILIQQRLHEEDLAGYLLPSGEWTHLNLPALAEEEHTIALPQNRVYVRRVGECLDPHREPLDVLNAIKKDIGSAAFAAQYQQRPTPLDGGYIKGDWFKYYETPPGKEHKDRIVQSWDTASKTQTVNDYSVCTTWLIKDNQCYLLDVFRERLEFPDLKKKILSLAVIHHADLILIEDAGAGTGLIQDLRSESSLNIVDIQPEGDKVARTLMATPTIEAGRVWLPKEAHWLADFLHEVMVFDKGKHDDQVDSMTQFINWCRQRPTPVDMSMAFVVRCKMATGPWGEEYVPGSVLDGFLR